MSNQFAPEYIAELKAYSSAKSEKLTGSTWLNANESPYTNDYEINLESLNRYPDPQPESVVNAYANYANVNADNILMTRGADEGIELLIRTFCQSGVDSITQFLPTYGMYKVSAESSNISLNDLTQTDLIEGDINDIVSKSNGAKIIFVCNPNNPTGNTIQLTRIKEIVAAFGGKAIVVVDEAYIEFCEELTAAKLVNEFDNLVVLRTLSKAFALAGLRTGFVISNPILINTMRKVLAPYPVSGVVAQVAEQALTPCNISRVKRQVSILKDNRNELERQLAQCNKVVNVLPSNANFVTIQVSEKQYINSAMKAGLILRPFTLFDQDTWVRISIGSEQELSVVFNWLVDING